jgi:hypothetical protein
MTHACRGVRVLVRRPEMRIVHLLWMALLVGLVGCSMRPVPHLQYIVNTEPQLPEGSTYYIDSLDSSVVWSREGVQVKVRFHNDEMLDRQFPSYSPFTLKGWTHPVLGFTPPLWTTFEITVINRTRPRVELDPTKLVLRADGGQRFRCRQGAGVWYDEDEYFDYSHVKWASRAGNVHYRATRQRDDIWRRHSFDREKPVRQGRKYSGFVTFPPLPPETKAFSLEINDFILSFDRFEVGRGEPLEFTSMAFDFEVDQGTVEVSEK